MHSFLSVFHRSLSVALVAGMFVAPAAKAETGCASCGVSEASQALSQATGVMVNGSAEMLAASGALSVASIEASGESTVIVLNGASNAVVGAVKLSEKAAKEASLAVGKVVEVSAVSTGYLLIASGKVIAFIPNELGKALLHHSRVEE
jgi:hypothetical protein